MSAHTQIRHQSVFEPHSLEAMIRALDEACAALEISDVAGRNIIAVRILDLASIGVVDAEALRERLLREAALSEL